MDATITRIGDAVASEYRTTAPSTDSARPAGFVEITRFDSFSASLSAAMKSSTCLCVIGAAAA